MDEDDDEEEVESPGEVASTGRIGRRTNGCRTISSRRDFAAEAAAPNMELKRYSGFMTPLIMLGYTIDFASADATADFDEHEKNLSDSVMAYGVKGKVSVCLHTPWIWC